MPLPPDYRALELIGAPVWIFDIDHRRVHWANSAALRVWNAAALDELCARDMGADMSESVARRLAQYQADFLGHGAEFHEQWTLYPGGKPVSLDVTFTGHRLVDGRMAMLCEARQTVQATPEALRSVEALLHTAVMITLYDMQGVPLYRNPAAREMVRAPDERLSERFTEPAAHGLLMQQLAAREVATLTQPVHTVSGVRWHELSVRKCRDAVSGDAAILLSEVDVTLLKESEAQASYLAVHDALTGLPNRNQVKLHFAQAMRELRAGGGQAALVLIDLDHFKNVNDTYGHVVGSQTIKQVGEIIEASLRKSDVAARYGGEEYVAYLTDIPTSTALLIAERIREAIGRHEINVSRKGSHVRLSVTISIGISTYPVHGDDPIDLIEKADLALYRAKMSGRNCVVEFDQSRDRFDEAGYQRLDLRSMSRDLDSKA